MGVSRRLCRLARIGQAIPVTTGGDPVHELAEAVRAVRAVVAGTGLPLRLPSAGPAAAIAAAVAGQIDDYLLPRLAHLDAPMLAVVGGSTGAGKSTLVNSLVRAPVSAVGVLRPTTRSPVLVCHPADTPWFRSDRLLGGLRRTSGPVTPDPDGAQPPQVQLIAAPALPPGLAFLDAPDIDSVVAGNRALADQLFAAADLWLFLTTAARYADEVPWRLLGTARERGAVVALVLSRVPPGATVELVGLLTELLTEHGLAGLPLFVLPETRIDRQGLLPEAATEPLRSWFDGLAADPAARAGVIRCTLDGGLAALPPKLAELAAATDEQLAAAEALAEQVGLAYGLARGAVERGVRDGVLQPAPAVPGARVPVDEWARAVRATVGGWQDRVAELTGRPAGPRHRRSAAESGLVTLVGGAAGDAAAQVDLAWRAHPAGSALLADATTPGASPELARRVQQVAREWPAGDLLERIDRLLDREASRWLDRLAGAPVDGSPGRRLREAAAALERARVAAKLTVDPPVAAEPAGPPAAPDPAAAEVAAPDPAAAEVAAPDPAAAEVAAPDPGPPDPAAPGGAPEPAASPEPATPGEAAE
jgi:hypothetical protein